jgi:DNA polymerase elongation subunit (family B)
MVLITNEKTFVYNKIEECFIRYNNIHTDILNLYKNEFKCINSTNPPGAIMCLFGSENNTPFILRVYGFRPFLYIETNKSVTRMSLRIIIQEFSEYVIDAEYCELVPYKQAFTREKKPFIKLYLKHSIHKRILCKKLQRAGYHVRDNKSSGFLQFITSKSLSTLGQIYCKPFTLRTAIEETLISKRQPCNEYDIFYTNIYATASEEIPQTLSHLNNMLWMAYDIENLFERSKVSKNVSFPIILISYVLFMPLNGKILECGIFTTKSVNHKLIAKQINLETRNCIHNLGLHNIDEDKVTITQCPNELSMINTLTDFIKKNQVVVLAGFNSKFDYNELHNRYLFLTGGLNLDFGTHIAGVSRLYSIHNDNIEVQKREDNYHKITDFFSYFSCKEKLANVDETEIKKICGVHTPGIYHYDVMRYYISNEAGKHQRFSLNCISQNKLTSMCKDDVKYDDIFDYWMDETGEKRTTLAKYCLIDSLLVCFLIMKDKQAEYCITQSLLCSAELQDIFNFYSMICTFSNFYREAYKQNLCFLYSPDKQASGVNKLYKGAKVFDPHIGFFNQPIICIDFKSQYALIMIGRNVCYSTQITLEYITENNLKENQDYFSINLSNSKTMYFLAQRHYKSVTASVVEELIIARDKVKEKIKTMDKNDPEISIMQTWGDCLKKRANSIYGYYGAQHNKDIAESITQFARKDICNGKTFLEHRYSSELKCTYGDTDSLFCTVTKNGELQNIESVLRRENVFSSTQPNDIMRGLFRIGEKYCNIINNGLPEENIEPIVPAPSMIEMEKVMYPVCFIAKKTYFGIMWNSLVEPSLVVKGMGCIKSDSSFLQKIIQTIVVIDTCNGDFEGMRSRIQKIINCLMNSRMPFSWVSIKKRISRPLNEYRSTAPHIRLAREECTILGLSENQMSNKTIEYIHVIDLYNRQQVKCIDFILNQTGEYMLYDKVHIFKTQIKKFVNTIMHILEKSGYIRTKMNQPISPVVSIDKKYMFNKNRKELFLNCLSDRCPSEISFVESYMNYDFSQYKIPQVVPHKSHTPGKRKQTTMMDFLKKRQKYI